jgi:hypothetical protein
MTYVGTRPPQNAFSSPGSWTLNQAAVRQQQALWPVDADPHWASVVLLIQPTAQNTTYTTDATGKTITTVGAVPLVGQGAFPGGAGFSFVNNTANYLTLADTVDWELGGTFTIEALSTMAAGGTNQHIIGQWSGAQQAFRLGIGTTNILSSVITSTTQYITPTPSSFSQLVGAPIHTSMVLNGGTLTTYYNGVAVSSAGGVTGTLTNATNTLRIGLLEDGPIWPFNGVIHSIRITKGVARYTSAFTPPARPFPTR